MWRMQPEPSPEAAAPSLYLAGKLPWPPGEKWVTCCLQHRHLASDPDPGTPHHILAVLLPIEYLLTYLGLWHRQSKRLIPDTSRGAEQSSWHLALAQAGSCTIVESESGKEYLSLPLSLPSLWLTTVEQILTSPKTPAGKVGSEVPMWPLALQARALQAQWPG